MNRREFLRGFIAPLLQDDKDKSAVKPSVPSVPTAGSPRGYARGTRVLVEDVQAWLCRDDGGFFAIDTESTNGLRYLFVDLDATGHLTISRDRVSDPRDRLMA